MKLIQNEDIFLNDSQVVLKSIANELDDLPILDTKGLSSKNTAIIVIDMINGFAKQGALYSERIQALIPYIANTLEHFKGYPKLFLNDAHDEDSPEFIAYPPHCVDGTEEAMLVDELVPFIEDNGLFCKKNSTNGFFSPDFAKWFSENNDRIENYLVLGDCTDLCVLQFSLTLKAFLNQWNNASNVIVPTMGVDTYHLEETHHNANLMNLFALYNMKSNGVLLIRDWV